MEARESVPEEVVEYLNKVEEIAAKTLKDPVKYERTLQAENDHEKARRGLIWLAMMDVLEFLERDAEFVCVPIGIQLKTLRLEIVGETEKAWKLLCHSAYFRRPLVEWLPKSQTKCINGFLFVKGWLIRQVPFYTSYSLRDAAIEFVAAHLAKKSGEYKELADWLFEWVAKLYE